MNFDWRLLALAGAVRFHLLATVGLGLAAGIITILQAFYLSRVVGAVFLGGSDLPGVQGELLVLLALVVARALAVGSRDAVASLAAARVKAALRERFFAKLVARGPAYVIGERTGELAATAVEGIEALDAYFSQYLPNLALAVLLPAAILLVVFPLDLVSGAVFLLTAPLIPLFMVLIGKMADRLTREQWQSLSRLSAHFLDVLQGLATLKAFGRSREQVAAIARVSGRFGDATMRVLRVAFVSALTLELLATVSTAIVAVEVGLRLLYGTIAFEQAFFVLVLAPEFYLPLRALGASFHAGMSGVAAAERVFGVLEVPHLPFPQWGEAAERGLPALALVGRAWAGGGEPEEVDREFTGAQPHPSPPPAGCGEQPDDALLRFHHVYFAYGDRGRPALDDVSFTVAAGQKVALVGPSGAGKSTIAHLVLGFIVPQAGEIRLGGKPLSRLSAREWRQKVAWVPQNPYLFNASVAENIRLARPQASAGEVERAARLASAHGFITALPRGYDTVLGERGARLSGGQAQRIALARAFLKDAPLLVLDEPSANLDPEGEAELQTSLAELLRGRTALIIAHRLATVYRADRILVLAQGRVVQAGVHADLLASEGLYRRLVLAHGGGV